MIVVKQPRSVSDQVRNTCSRIIDATAKQGQTSHWSKTPLLSKMKRHRSGFSVHKEPFSCDSAQSLTYDCHSLNSYNICLCGTTKSIQRVDSTTMETFCFVRFFFFVTFATRLWAQWQAVLWLSQRSHCTEWTSSWASCTVYRCVDPRHSCRSTSP